MKRDCSQFKEAIELRKQYKEYKETKRFKRENLEGNYTNGDGTNEEQNIENDEGSSGSMQDIADGDVEMLSQEGESINVMLEEDRNEENQQKVQDNTLQQTEINADVQQDGPSEQLDTEKKN